MCSVFHAGVFCFTLCALFMHFESSVDRHGGGENRAGVVWVCCALFDTLIVCLTPSVSFMHFVRSVDRFGGGEKRAGVFGLGLLYSVCVSV